MSRCFPFPPPGYEKKARNDDVDLLKKEKDGEKKHKKEKKNKEKREGKEKEKEKGEKEKSDGKHRDKKDKKEKRRDKKEKDRDKSKDKISVLDEKRLSGQSGHNNGDKTLDGKKLQDKSESNSGRVFPQKGNEGDVDSNSNISEQRFCGQFSGFNGQKLSQNSNSSEHSKDSKLVQEVGKKARDEDRNQVAERSGGTGAKTDEGMVRLVVLGTSVEGKEKKKRDDDRKLEGQGNRVEAIFSGAAQNFQRMVPSRIDGMPRLLEKGNEKVEGKDKAKRKEGDDKHGDKHKDKDKEKKSKRKDKDRDKEKKKEEKIKEKSEHKKTESDKSKGSKGDSVGNHNVKIPYLPKESIESAVNEGNIKKRKDSDTNGFLHACDIKPNKLSRPTSSLQPLTENGRKLETSHIPTTLVTGRTEVINTPKVDDKEHINGLTEVKSSIPSSTQSLSSIPSSTQLPSISLPKSSTKLLPATAQAADQIGEVTRRQPHPDSKYLSELLTVPKMEDCLDFDDQEWLFQSTDSLTKKAKVGSSGVEEDRQVWSEALQIDSVDFFALPYVIPY